MKAKISALSLMKMTRQKPAIIAHSRTVSSLLSVLFGTMQLRKFLLIAITATFAYAADCLTILMPHFEAGIMPGRGLVVGRLPPLSGPTGLG